MDGVVPVISETELRTAPCGFYRLNKPKLRDVFDIVQGVRMTCLADQFVRVTDDVRHLVDMGLDLEIRPDGKAIVRTWSAT